METKIEPVAPTGGIHRQLLTAYLASIPALEYGQMVAWVSATLSLLQSPDTPASAPLSDLNISVMASVLPFGAIFGTACFSYASDHFGRKPSIMLLSLLFSLSWALKLASPEAPSLIAARVIGGLASGGLFVVVPIYVREVSQDSMRGALGVLVLTSYNIGVILVYLFGIYLAYYQSLVVCLVIALTHLVLFFFMPETPVYCVKKQRYDDATKNLAWLRNKDVSNASITEEIDRLKRAELLSQELPSASICEIVKNKAVHPALCLAIVILVVQALSGNFAVITFATNIFERAHTPWSSATLGLFVAGMQLAGSFVSISTIERLGRKPLLLFSLLAISVCMATIGTWFVLVTSGVAVPGWVPVAGVCSSIFSYSVGLACLPGIIMAEIFNFECRARLAGIAIMISWSMSSGVNLGFMPLANAVGAGVCFYFFSTCALLGAVYIAVNQPETKGKTYEEIERAFHKKRGEKKEEK